MTINDLKRKERVWKGIKVIDYAFPLDQYYPDHTHKTTIGLHHMASGEGLEGDINWWLGNKQRVATCCAIARDGHIVTLFSSKGWAHSLGVRVRTFDGWKIPRIYRFRESGTRYVANNEILNQQMIAVELDSWGQLTEKNGRYYSWTGKEIATEDVQVYDKPYRGSRYYERYTTKQIESLRLLLIYWRDTYHIDITYNPEMWEVSRDALSGKGGLWSHTSYRADKSDVHPQRDLVEMLHNVASDTQ